ncbi:MAG TPA: tRNA pseudouridine(38-40) synthase TruA [Dehalococcoidia bacterium]|jgi:tRNA pseudouridine38-40 synthase
MANREDPGRKLALLVEYEGTAFGGSQFQKNAPTVQGTLERALGSLTGEPIRVAMAGRTDAGVHARGQVVSFVTRSRHSAATVVRAANALLPEAVSIRAACEVPLDFDPRRQATSRWYRYTLDTGPQRPALMRRSVWHITAELDMGAMAEAARSLEGRHDFAAFTAPSEAKRSVTIRNVRSAAWRCGGRLATFEIEANAFLPHMVRRIAGTLVEVGQGRLTPGEFERMVNEAPPGAASRTAPPRGLCLMKVRYESGLFDDETDEDI